MILKGREAFRKKKTGDEEKGGMIKFMKLPPNEEPLERFPCVRVLQDLDRETIMSHPFPLFPSLLSHDNLVFPFSLFLFSCTPIRKGKLVLTPSYLCFNNKSKGFLRQKEKLTLAVHLTDVKEIKKVFLFTRRAKRNETKGKETKQTTK